MTGLYKIRDIDWSLYAIIDSEWLCGRDIGDIAKQIIRGGAGIIQYRDKVSEGGQFYHHARQLREVTHKHHIPLIINDRVDVALAIQADGIHLGQDDLPIDVVRGIVGDQMILGGSVHSIPEYEKVKGADYFGVGAIFSTQTKNSVLVGGVEIIKQIRVVTSKPILGIGGVTVENLSQVIHAGAEGVAVISGILDSDDVTKRTKQYVDVIQKTKTMEVV